MMSEARALERLERDGLLFREGERLRTTRKWNAAMARAALRLSAEGSLSPASDLRLPIAVALLEFYGTETDDEVATLVDALAPIEAAEPASVWPAS